jgi:uncharacterized membrane protein YccC
MTFETHKVLFSCKSFASAILAVFIAFTLGLDRPIWALVSAYIVSQPQADAVRSKAFYRLIGTFLGAIMTVIIVPNFVNMPIALTAVLSLWISLCLFVSVLDRTPRAYGFLLAGYTTAIIGFPSVNAPELLFETAVSRVIEISLGISCAVLIHSLVLPQRILSSFHDRLNGWWGNANQLLRHPLSPAQNRQFAHDWQNLAMEVSQLSMLSTHLTFDSANHNNTHILLALDEKMAEFLAKFSQIFDQLRTLVTYADEADFISLVLQRLHFDTFSPELLKQLDLAIQASLSTLGPTCEWYELLKINIVQQISHLQKIHNDSQVLRHYLATPSNTTHDIIHFRSYQTKQRPMHQDFAAALASAVSTFTATMVVSIFWISTGWVDGAGATLMTAVGCCFFANQLNPVPFIIRFIYGVMIAVPFALFYAFVVLPRVDGFFLLVVMLAPFYLISGYLMASLRWVGLSTAANIFFTNLIEVQSRYNSDLAVFMNSTLGLLIGLSAAAIFSYIFRSLSNERHILTMRKAIGRDIDKMLSSPEPPHSILFVLKTVDRLGILAPLILAEDNQNQFAFKGMQSLNLGLYISELKKITLKGSTDLRDLLKQLTRYLRHGALAHQSVLSQIDLSLANALAQTTLADQQHVILTLTGIRNLFTHNNRLRFSIQENL